MEPQWISHEIYLTTGELRPIAPGYLHQVLELLLNVLIALSLPHDAAPVDELVSTLANDHEVAHDVTKQVLSWFGEVDAGKWNMDVKSVVKEIGLNLLRRHRVSQLCASHRA
jgi:sister chromatid cohesion protein DCC1